MFSHLIVPLDGSELAEEALPVAQELCQKFNARITLLQVLVGLPQAAVDPLDETHDTVLGRIHEKTYQAGHDYLDEKAAELEEAGCPAQTMVIEDHSPADAILKAVAMQDADAIVMCTHGRSGISRWVFGSVAERVMRAVQIPVVLIKTGSESA